MKPEHQKLPAIVVMAEEYQTKANKGDRCLADSWQGNDKDAPRRFGRVGMNSHDGHGRRQDFRERRL